MSTDFSYRHRGEAHGYWPPARRQAIVSATERTVHGGWRAYAAAQGLAEGLIKRVESCWLRQREVVGLG